MPRSPPWPRARRRARGSPAAPRAGKGSGGKGVKGAKGDGGKGDGGGSSGGKRSARGRRRRGRVGRHGVHRRAAGRAGVHPVGPGPTVHARLQRRQGGGRGADRLHRRRAGRPAGAALRRVPHRRDARDPVGGAGDGHRRQGRDHAARRGVGRPAGGALHRVQGPDRAGEGPSLPVAHPQRAADTRADRGVRPLPLRGRADRPRARPGAPGDLGPPLRPDQHASSPPWWSRARPSSR